MNGFACVDPWYRPEAFCLPGFQASNKA